MDVAGVFIALVAIKKIAILGPCVSQTPVAALIGLVCKRNPSARVTFITVLKLGLPLGDSAV